MRVHFRKDWDNPPYPQWGISRMCDGWKQGFNINLGIYFFAIRFYKPMIKTKFWDIT